MRKRSIIKAWQGRRGENIEMGAQLVITDEMMATMDASVKEKIKDLVVVALTRKLVEDSLIPQSLLIALEKDVAMRWEELYFMVETKLEPTLLPLALKMDALLRKSKDIMLQKRISAKRKEEWLDDLANITGERYKEV